MGIEKGKGFNVNIPWNLDLENDKDFTARNEEYIYIMERIIIPILQSYQPELLLISSGFDGCKVILDQTILTKNIFFFRMILWDSVNLILMGMHTWPQDSCKWWGIIKLLST